MKRILLIFALCLIIFVGCKEGYISEEAEETEPQTTREELDKAKTATEGFDTQYGEEKFEAKTIKTAYVTVHSNRVNESCDKTLLLVKKYNGLIVNSSTSKYEEKEEAVIEIKILPKHFLTFIDELKTIGDVESKSISEEDVTEEYYDIEARYTNALKVQKRLFDLLKKANRVEDILKIEKEIERVGENIETFEGRIKYLNSKTNYAHITVTIYNRKISLIGKIGIKEGFAKSIRYAIHFFFGIIWFIIVLIPLVILIIIIWLIIVKIIRKKRDKK